MTECYMKPFRELNLNTSHGWMLQTLHDIGMFGLFNNFNSIVKKRLVKSYVINELCSRLDEQKYSYENLIIL